MCTYIYIYILVNSLTKENEKLRDQVSDLKQSLVKNHKLIIEMESKYNFKPDPDTYIALLDASMAANDFDKSMWAFEKLEELRCKVTINRVRKLVRGLCLERRKADAFAVFNGAVASGVPCDSAICSDLIDLLQQAI